MTQKVNVLLIDDIDGSDADETIQFGLDGARYEIDLNTRHAQGLRSALASYVEHARKASGSAGRPRARRTAVNGTSNKEVREWAAANGFKVSERGRIPTDVIAKYEAANAR